MIHSIQKHQFQIRTKRISITWFMSITSVEFQYFTTSIIGPYLETIENFSKHKMIKSQISGVCNYQYQSSCELLLSYSDRKELSRPQGCFSCDRKILQSQSFFLHRPRVKRLKQT